MESVYSFSKSCRGGTLTGLFVAEKSEVESLMGEEIYFGEVLGKHSDVVIEITEENVKLVTSDPYIVSWLKNDMDGGIGYNPFDYIEETDDVED